MLRKMSPWFSSALLKCSLNKIGLPHQTIVIIGPYELTKHVWTQESFFSNFAECACFEITEFAVSQRHSSQHSLVNGCRAIR